MFERIFKYAGPYKKTTILASVVILFAVLVNVVPFFFVYQIIAPIIMGKGMTLEYITLRIVGILICLVLHGVLYVKGLGLSHKAAFNILMRLRVSLQGRMEKLPLGIIMEKGIGSAKRIFVDDIDNIEVLLAHAIPEGFGNCITAIIIYIALFFVDWKLALISLASLPLGMFAMGMMMWIGNKDMVSYYRAGQVMNDTIIEYINGMEVVKVFNKDGESYERYHKAITGYRDFTLDWYKACWPWMAIYNSILPATIILTLPLGSWSVLKGYATLPDLVLVLCLSMSIGGPLLKTLNFVPSLPQLNYKIETLEKLLDAEPVKQNEKPFRGKDHTITFEHVSFGYNEEQVIDDVSLTIKEGEKTALVGESGSGKSTLAKLLVHYYDANKGIISIGGQEITQMSLEALNKEIAYVSQEQYLFNISILENIRIGNLEASDKEVIEAARKAQCMEFINQLPKGIHTLAGDSGNQLSGGQRQRIALARAILKNASIIVLDEATAYTDPENEEKMETAIAEVVKGKTLLVIAHRLGSIKNADQICVMAKGKIVARGSHENLIKTSKDYQRLWNASMESRGWQVNNREEEEIRVEIN
ncbi:MAG: ABC transporter ATP-binding protein [Cellulosilyticum sp.]|nr:ABC transporter ATP-binding protein [Cellulosilyticum sp.]